MAEGCAQHEPGQPDPQHKQPKRKARDRDNDRPAHRVTEQAEHFVSFFHPNMGFPQCGLKSGAGFGATSTIRATFASL